jgi:hypothetical protein
MEFILAFLVTGLVLFAVLVGVAYVVVRVVFVRIAERISAKIAVRMAGAAPHVPVLPVVRSPGALALLARLDRTARLMDRAIPLPFAGGIGLDALLGFIPYVGDAVSAGISGSIILNSLQYGLPRALVAQMVANMFVDLLFGAIPIVGDVFDIFFKANERNMALLRAHLERPR